MPESKTEKTVADLRQIARFLFNQSQRTPSEETYGDWQKAISAAIAAVGGSPKEPLCPKCKWTGFKHMHDSAYVFGDTHMAGSERFECGKCGHAVYAAEGKPLGFIFILD